MSLGQHRWHSIACFGWTFPHRFLHGLATQATGCAVECPKNTIFIGGQQSWLSSWLCCFSWVFGIWAKKKTKFGQIINSSHEKALSIPILKPWWTWIFFQKVLGGQLEEVHVYHCIVMILFCLVRLEQDTCVCCTLLTTTNYVTDVALKDRCDHTAMTKQLFSRYKISSQCLFHVISSKKIQQLAASGPWPTEHVVGMSLGARKYHTWDPQNVGSFWGRISMYHAHACVSWSKFHVGRCKTICSGMWSGKWSWHWLVLDKYTYIYVYIYIHMYIYIHIYIYI